MRGGYQLINLRQTALTAGEAATVAGIYEALEGNYYKQTVLTGFVLDNTEYDDMPISFIKDGTTFKGVACPQINEGKLAVLEVSVAEGDSITVTKTEIEGV